MKAGTRRHHSVMPNNDVTVAIRNDERARRRDGIIRDGGESLLRSQQVTGNDNDRGLTIQHRCQPLKFTRGLSLREARATQGDNSGCHESLFRSSVENPSFRACRQARPASSRAAGSSLLASITAATAATAASIGI